MNNLSRCAFLAAVFALSSCGGGSPSPTAPTATPAPALTVTTVARTLGAEINSAFIAAMRSGVPVASRDRGARPDYLTLVIEMFTGVPLYAQTGFVANCSSGGNVRVQFLGAAPGGGRVTLANTPVTFSSCAHSLNGRSVAASGTLMASGSWTASEPTTPVRLSGDLTVDDIGVIAIDGATGASFIGAVGGISIGVADTPPPPNPTPLVCPTPIPTPECPAPAPAPPAPAPPAPTPPAPAPPTPPAPTPPAPTAPTPPAPTPPAPTPPPTGPTTINLTGAWRQSSSADALILTQSGSTLSGTVTVSVPPPPPFGVVANSVGGSIAGSNVTFTWTYVFQAVIAGATIKSSTTSTFTGVASSSSSMSGSVVMTATVSCTGDKDCPPSVTTGDTTSVTLTKG